MSSNRISKEEGTKYFTEPRIRTSIEGVVEEWLTSWGIVFDWDRGFSTEYRPDFLIESHKLIIECDGLYWHSESNARVTRDYHKKKKEAYRARGYRSLFFRENEILGTPEIVRSILMNALGLCTKKIGARSTKVVDVDNTFFVQNHLMGKGRGHKFGLQTSSGEVVAGIQVDWVRGEPTTLDISRFCTLQETSVPGGFTKLLSHAAKKLDPKSIQTFIDLRYGEGAHLASQGWEKKSSSLSFRWTDHVKTYHRMRFSGNTGYDQGLVKIWDCGQAKWVIDSSTFLSKKARVVGDQRKQTPTIVFKEVPVAPAVVGIKNTTAYTEGSVTVLRNNKRLKQLQLHSRYEVVSAEVRHTKAGKPYWMLKVKDLLLSECFQYSANTFMGTLRADPDHVFTDKFGEKSESKMLARYQSQLETIGMGAKYLAIGLVEQKRNATGTSYVLRFKDLERNLTFVYTAGALIGLLRKNPNHKFRPEQVTIED